MVGTITQPTCANPTGSVSLSGLPSSGAWTVTASPGGSTITGTSGTTTATFRGLAAGKYAFTVKNNFGCSSSLSSYIIINTPSTLSTSAGIIEVTGNGPICASSPSRFTIRNGKAGEIVRYSINGGAEQSIVLKLDGTAEIDLGNQTTTQTIILTKIVTVSGCESSVTSLKKTATISINPSPTKGAAISVVANGPFCVNGTGVFTVSGGEPNGSVKYKIDSGAEQTKTLDNSGSTTINLGNITKSKSIVLTSITTSNGCTSIITSASSKATIFINSSSTKAGTISVKGNGPFCMNGNGIFSVSGGELNGIVKYSINGGAQQTLSLDVSGSGTISINNITSNQLIELKNVGKSDGCLSTVTSPNNKAQITVGGFSEASKTISVYSNGNVCSGGNGGFTIKNGEGNSVLTYLLNNIQSEVRLDQNGFTNININNITSSQNILLLYFTSISGCNTKISSVSNNAKITVENSAAITTPLEQNFCWKDYKKIKDLVVEPNNVIWFDASTGGNRLNPEEILKSKPYYGVSATCINSPRVKTNVVVRDPKPIITNTEVNFCDSLGKLKIADLKPNGVNVMWFKDASNTVELAPTTLLSSTSYYVSERLGSCTFNRTKVNVNFINNFIIGDTLVCKGTKTQLRVYNSNSTLKYKWSNGDTSEITNVVLEKSTTYWVDIITKEMTCRKYITLKVIPITVPILTIMNQSSICLDGFAKLNILNSNVNSKYSWYKNNNLISIGTNIFETKENGRFYAIDVSNKCSSTSNTVDVNFNDVKISIQPIANLLLKSSNEIELIASPSGGTFFGEGVSGKYFYPRKCRLGTKKITYRLQSQNGICNGTSTISTIIVDSTENICHYYDTVKVTKYDTIKTYTSVTDTLKIKLKLTTGIYTKQFNNIKIYPNPTVSDVVVDFGNYKYMQGYYLSITDVNGKKLNAIPITQQLISVNLGSLGGTGIYFFNFHDNNSKIIESKKIVLE